MSEAGSGGPLRYARNRCACIQSWFRRNPLWAFWKLDYQIKSDLFFGHKRRQARAPGQAAGSEDPTAKLFGTAIPSNIPESTAWWKRQQKDLYAITDDAELGLMQEMITISHNDYCPEMLAAIRRGAFAQPTEEEKVEYLLTRIRRDRQRPRFENFAFEHVLSFQRRVQATKQHFFSRSKRTPLGDLEDWWAAKR